MNLRKCVATNCVRFRKFAQLEGDSSKIKKEEMAVRIVKSIKVDISRSWKMHIQDFNGFSLRKL